MMLKMKKYLPVLVAAVLILGVGGARADGTPNKSAPLDKPKCTDMMIEMGGIKMAVPQDARVELASPGTTEINLGACGTGYMRHVRTLYLSGGPGGVFHISAPAPSGKEFKGKTEYTFYKDKIDNYRKEGHSKMLPDGVEYLETPTDAFILPLDKAPTKNGEPVFLSCSGDAKIKPDESMLSNELSFKIASCTTDYVHPLGFFVFYRFSRGYYPRESSYLEVDQEKRAQIDAVIKAFPKQLEKKQGKKP